MGAPSWRSLNSGKATGASTWRFLNSGKASGAWNMAVDAALLEAVVAEKKKGAVLGYDATACGCGKYPYQVVQKLVG